MKNQILSMTYLFASILLIVIVFTAFSSPVDEQVEAIMNAEDNSKRELSFANENTEIHFTEQQYYQVLEIVKRADSLVDYWRDKDSTVLIPIGKVDSVTFDYRYYHFAKTHFIVIKTQKDSVYFNKYTTFVDNLKDY